MDPEQHEIRFTCYCTLCKKSQFFSVANPKMKTTRLSILILRSLHCLNPQKDFFSLKTDIYNFITDHWNLLGKLKLFQSVNWKKNILDAFNHCSQIESGLESSKGRGFYRLKKEDEQEDKATKVELLRELYEKYDELEVEVRKSLHKLCLYNIKNGLQELEGKLTLLDVVDRQLAFTKHIGTMRCELCNLR
ncbi:hypothetical protein EIN_380750 [Entamoeba invadens IP1]|uniref:Uncharacterized protein n=1 Tax=Entamoeba invadens IP1 TaxID=370355 RepID=A0A0A1UAM6_ENTIV|nr:hypothetical protein EIN_380750 [Entamoeba invadens IP1]ELP92128.1 hypothetical protein EIN_380750 [Entamoeba invadens IP1]|eukprot:XP_004258899.1 hypothetical protein EIN_380750 [Entamoeba invadens IP1]